LRKPHRSDRKQHEWHLWAGLSGIEKRDLAIGALYMAVALSQPPKGAFIPQIVDRNTAHMTIRSAGQSMDLKSPLSWFANKPLPGSG
jgi:hypothetical protein|tara:strand:- start:141 stop:401 length:261 start_codon:yes stop_codon:yes gene_type:complete